MTAQPEHSWLIAEAARAILVPLGVRRIGRSRSWLDDRGWWLGIVEFQPSGFSKGSHLNVGVMWLWDELPHHAYDVGYRVHDFEPFEDNEQFRRVAVSLAQKAADEIIKYRAKFATTTDCATYFAKNRDVAPSDYMTAGIALGLVGKVKDAQKWFDASLAIDDGRPFVLDENQRIRGLRVLLEDQSAFKDQIRASIARTRELLRKPPLAKRPF